MRVRTTVEHYKQKGLMCVRTTVEQHVRTTVEHQRTNQCLSEQLRTTTKIQGYMKVTV